MPRRPVWLLVGVVATLAAASSSVAQRGGGGGPPPRGAPPPGFGLSLREPPPAPSEPVHMTPQEALAWIALQKPDPELDKARQDIETAMRPSDPEGPPRIAVFSAEQSIGRTTEGRWTPTQAQADEAWIALMKAAREHGLMRRDTLVIFSTGGVQRTVQGIPITIGATQRIVSGFNPPFRLSDYLVQAAGVTAQPGTWENRGKAPVRGIAINGLDSRGRSPRTAELWRTNWAIVSDGGDSYFQAFYDPAAKQVVRFAFNGPVMMQTPGW